MLFVSDRLPLPSRDGIESPLAHYMTYLRQRHEIRLAFVTQRAPDQQAQERMAENVKQFGDVATLITRRIDRTAAIAGEIRLARPAYQRWRFDPKTLQTTLGTRPVDVVWVAPPDIGGFAAAFRTAYVGTRAKLVLGVHDARYVKLMDNAREVMHKSIDLRRWTRTTTDTLIDLARTPLTMFHEARQLRHYDAVQVQTVKEANRLRAIMDEKSGPQIIVATNGAPIELGNAADARTGSYVLVNGTLQGRQGVQIAWFVRRVWPAVLAACPQARLRITGRFRASDENGMGGRGVEWLGYVSEEREMFRGVAVTALPADQASGIVNRALSAMAARSAVVGFERTLHAIRGFQNEVHGLTVRNAEGMVQAIVCLLCDPPQREKLACAGQALAAREYHWERTLTALEEDLQRLAEGR